MKRGLLLLMIVSFCFLVIIGCNGDPPESLRLLVSGSTNGLLEPCDCEVGALGGLAKRATLFRFLDPDHRAIWIDAGGMVDELVDPGRFPAIGAALEAFPYDRLLVGEPDTLLYRKWMSDNPRVISSFDRIDTLLNGTPYSIISFNGRWLDQMLENKLSESSFSPFFINRKSDSPNYSPEGQPEHLTVWVIYTGEPYLSRLFAELPGKFYPDCIIQGRSDYSHPAEESFHGIPLFPCGTDGMEFWEILLLSEPGGNRVQGILHEVGDSVPEAPDIRKIVSVDIEQN